MCEFTEDHDLLAVLTRKSRAPPGDVSGTGLLLFRGVSPTGAEGLPRCSRLPSPHYRHTGTGLGKSMAREADRQTKRQRQKQRDTETERSVCVFVLECVRVCAHMRARE